MTAPQIVGVDGLPEIEPGDDLAALIAAAADLVDGDVVVVTSKIVSKAEGRIVELDDVEPSAVRRPQSADRGTRTRPRRGRAARGPRIVRMIGPVLITETHHGFVCANSGVDQSSSGAHGRVVVLPERPRRVGPAAPRRVRRARRRRRRHRQRHVRAPVAGGTDRRRHRRRRHGPIDSYIGQVDPHGHEFRVQALCVVDELAGAAELVKGNVSRVPVAVIRGYAWERDDTATIAPVLRDRAHDLFR